MLICELVSCCDKSLFFHCRQVWTMDGYKSGASHFTIRVPGGVRLVS
jgi:hypothetical protein